MQNNILHSRMYDLLPERKLYFVDVPTNDWYISYI